jgi:hypothetical protein
MNALTPEDARARADEFVRTQTCPPEYTLAFESVSEIDDRFHVKYTKKFKEPTKENPPYRLVIVDRAGLVSWGNP